MLKHPLQELLEVIEKAANEQAKNNTNTAINKTCGDMQDFLQPGNIVLASNNGEKLIGVMLQAGTMIKINSQGQIIGYLRDFDATTPLTIEAIYKPTREAYALHDYRNMDLVWKKKPCKVNKSLREIEDALGLEPGSLEIK